MISVLMFGFLWWSSISEPRWQRDRVQQCTTDQLTNPPFKKTPHHLLLHLLNWGQLHSMIIKLNSTPPLDSTQHESFYLSNIFCRLPNTRVRNNSYWKYISAALHSGLKINLTEYISAALRAENKSDWIFIFSALGARCSSAGSGGRGPAVRSVQILNSKLSGQFKL